MSTADLSVIVNGIVDLAAIGTVGVLFFTRRWLFAASPKTDQQQQQGGKRNGSAAPDDASIVPGLDGQHATAGGT